ncbi:hypothetical protein ACFSTJ_09440 [Ottowia pentelensis]|uniref:hypothetical protein n=1 Tax=Ottowia pentelensis TaxID=511108 RepID=UPI003639E07F
MHRAHHLAGEGLKAAVMTWKLENTSATQNTALRQASLSCVGAGVRRAACG